MAGFRYHVFLSHNSDDKPAVAEIALGLKRENIEPWLDMWDLVPGEAWQPAIERALAESATCAVFIGSGGLGVWQNEEMRAAIDQRVAEGQEPFRVIPVLLPGTDRPERGKLPAFLRATTWVEFRQSLDDKEAFHRLVSGIRGEAPGASRGAAEFAGASPYRGLEVFDVEHAPFFLGREAETEWLVDALRPKNIGEENRFLAILGASGSGKSSLARAGLVAALKQGAIAGSGGWPILIMKPGHDPIESLAVALAGLPRGAALVKDARDILNIKALGEDQRSLHTIARLALRDAHASSRLFVLVDQAEEVFTLGADESARRAFFELLHHAATVARGRTIVVLTVRADFYGKFGAYPGIAATMSDHQRLVGPMTEDELRRAIEQPALKAGGELEPGLAATLLHDAAGQAGALPLLQFALLELWQRREGRLMTVAAYRSIGGLQGAIKNRADSVFSQFDETRRDLCRRIFLRLTQPGEGSEDTKRRASLAELIPSGTDPLVVESVVNRLADARLITTEGRLKTAGGASVEVAHEALIRGWGRLREWVDADRTGLRLQRQLEEAAREWEAHHRERSFLYSGTRLAAAREWAKTHSDQLNDREAAFLAASVRKRRTARGAQVASILLVLALGLAAWEWSRWYHRVALDQIAHAVDKDLEEARTLSLEGRWAEAIKQLEVSLGRLEPVAEHEPMRRRLASALESYKQKECERKAAERDAQIIAALDNARLLATAYNKERQFDSTAVVNGYRRAFRDNGIEIDTLPLDRAAELIRDRRPLVREALAAALDDWAWRVDFPMDLRPRAIARDADPDPLRNAIREAVAKNDIPALRRLTHEPNVDRLPVPTLRHMYRALSDAGRLEEALALNQRAQRLHPEDFWINCDLAVAFSRLVPPRLDEAIRYHSVAVAVRPNSPGAYLALGIVLYDAGRNADAFRAYESAIQLDPNDAVAIMNRGEVHQGRGELDNAVADYDAAIRLVPKYSNAYYNRGTIHRARHEYNEAIACYNKAIELDPKFALAHNARGNVYLDKEELDKAITEYSQAIRLDPKLAVAYDSRGDTWRKKREYEKAIADYGKVITLEPKNADAYIQRADVWSDKEEFDKAITDSEAALRIDPKRVWAQNGLGIAFAAKRAVEKAIKAYTEAIRVGPQHAIPYNNRGNVYLSQQQYDEAIADFSDAILRDPKYANAYNNRGDAWRAKREYEKAAADYGKVICLEPKNANAYIERANVWSDKKEFDKAIADCEAAVRIDPKNAWAHILLGFFFDSKQDSERAISEYTKAIGLDSKYAIAYNNRASIYLSKRHFGEAIADYTDAIRLDPKNASAYSSRAKAWLATREYEKAIADYGAVINLEPKNASAYLKRANVWSEREEFDKAIGDCGVALRLDPKNARIHAFLGFLLDSKHASDRAISEYTEAIRLDPKYVAAYGARANAWRAKGEYEKAMADYDEAIRLAPKNATAYRNRGAAWADKKEFDKAIADFTDAIVLEPKFAAAYAGRGWAWFRQHEYAKAMADFDTAIGITPEDHDALNGRGEVWHMQGEYDKAIAVFERMIQVDPECHEAHHNRGLCWYDQGDFDKAVADLAKAVRFRVGEAEAHYDLGRARYARREFEAALAEFGEATRLDSRDPKAFKDGAWIRATCPEANYRDGKQAVASATHACELTNWKDAACLDTLAAACAESGDFAAAIKWEEKALALPAKDGDPKRTELKSRLALFRAKQPYRQEPQSRKAPERLLGRPQP
jgi:tetratricopeptide (TPR) repeat protein